MLDRKNLDSKRKANKADVGDHGSTNGISIITPSLNQGNYLKQCLKSIELQECNINIEHIIIDAGSTDETHEVARQFDFSRLVVIDNCSQSEALNWGFKNCQYNIVCWLNADDILLQGALSTVASLKNRGTEDNFLLYSDYIDMDKNLENLSYRKILPFSPFVVRNFAIYMPTSGAFFSKSIIDNGVTLKDDLHYIMDRDFYLQLKDGGVEFIKLSEPLAAFRLHEEQKSAKGNNVLQRAAERSLINKRYGGLWIGKKCLLRWNKLFNFFGYLYVGVGSRIMAYFVLFCSDHKKTLTLTKEWANRLVTNYKSD